MFGPGWCFSMVRALAGTSKGHGIYFGQADVPRLQV